MKSLYIFASLIIFNTVIFAQSDKQQAPKSWIKQRGYIALTDKSHLPKSIMPYYSDIKYFVVKNHSQSDKFPDFSTAYILAKDVQENANTLSFAIFPLDGIKDLKDNEDKRTPAKYDKKIKMNIQLIDDFGGSVGEVIAKLDKVSRKITFYHTQ